MKYIDKTGLLGKLYYELVVVDLWCSVCEDGETIPVLSINMLRSSGGVAFIFKTPWTSLGIGWCYDRQ